MNLFAEGLTAAESDNYKLLLGIAAGGLAAHGHPPIEGARFQAFDTVLQCLSYVQPTGALWRGRPPFMSDTMLEKLQKEASERRKSARSTDRYELACGGEVADKFAASKELAAFVSELAPRMVPTGIASYIFYQNEGSGLDAHIDTEVFTLNLILMLDHSYIDNPSHLLLYPAGQAVERVLLKPGECLLLYAGGTVHAREDLKANEEVSLLTIGFAPE